MYSVSTSWNGLQAASGEAILKEIQDTGCRYLELGFSMSRKKVEQIQRSRFQYMLKISSVHNYCPVPVDSDPAVFTPDYYSLSSPDRQERRRALDLTIQTLHWAKELDAQAVIIHGGRVEIPEHTRELIALHQSAGPQSEEYQKLKNTMVKTREERKTPFLMSLVRSLDELISEAERLNIQLCLENRFYYREIPSFEEIGDIFADFKGARNLHNWHDVGHAEVRDRLGLEKHQEYLKAYQDTMFGIHLHDVRVMQDHLVPGQGDFNFKGLNPYLKHNTIKVIEVHQPATGEDIKKGIEFLDKTIVQPE